MLEIRLRRIPRHPFSRRSDRRPSAEGGRHSLRMRGPRPSPEAAPVGLASETSVWFNRCCRDCWISFLNSTQTLLPPWAILGERFPSRSRRRILSERLGCSRITPALYPRSSIFCAIRFL